MKYLLSTCRSGKGCNERTLRVQSPFVRILEIQRGNEPLYTRLLYFPPKGRRSIVNRSSSVSSALSSISFPPPPPDALPLRFFSSRSCSPLLHMKANITLIYPACSRRGGRARNSLELNCI